MSYCAFRAELGEALSPQTGFRPCCCISVNVAFHRFERAFEVALLLAHAAQVEQKLRVRRNIRIDGLRKRCFGAASNHLSIHTNARGENN